MSEDVLRAAVAAIDRGEPAAMVTVVSTSGSTPQRTGAKMLVFADGRTVGTIGGGCYESDAVGRAREAIREQRARIVPYDLNDDLAEESGLICGGQMEVYIEPVGPSPHLYIAGAGHISYYLARFASETGFRVTVVDDRAKYANAERFPGVEAVVAENLADWFARVDLAPGAFAVIVTRGHRHDLETLCALAPRGLRYLGMIGSRSKVAQVFDAAVSAGVSREALAPVHAPVGLDLGAVTPAEIAVSILAELIAVRSGRIEAPEVAARSMTLGARGGRAHGSPDAGV